MMRDDFTPNVEAAAHYEQSQAYDDRDRPTPEEYAEQEQLEAVALDEAVEDEYRLPCGCYEYHTADCHLVTGGSDSGMSKADYIDLFMADDYGGDHDHDDYPF